MRRSPKPQPNLGARTQTQGEQHARAPKFRRKSPRDLKASHHPSASHPSQITQCNSKSAKHKLNARNHSPVTSHRLGSAAPPRRRSHWSERERGRENFKRPPQPNGRWGREESDEGNERARGNPRTVGGGFGVWRGGEGGGPEEASSRPGK